MNVKYVCNDELDSDDRTVWILESLTFGHYNQILALQEEGRHAEALRLMVEYGLRGWSNFQDENGQPLIFSPENILLIPPETNDELAEKIFNISRISDEESPEIRQSLIRMTRLSEFLSESKQPEIWTCEWCREHGRQKERACPDWEEVDDEVQVGEKTKKEKIHERYGIKSRKSRDKDVGESLFSYRGYQFDVCPVSNQNLYAEILYGLVVRADNMGVLPRNGGWEDQDNLFVQAFDLVSSERSKIERNRKTEEDQKGKRGGRGGGGGGARKPRIPTGTRRRKLRR